MKIPNTYFQKLLPCKECGSATLCKYEKYFGYIAGCEKCKIWTPWADDKEWAIKRWNEEQKRSVIYEDS